MLPSCTVGAEIEYSLSVAAVILCLQWDAALAAVLLLNRFNAFFRPSTQFHHQSPPIFIRWPETHFQLNAFEALPLLNTISTSASSLTARQCCRQFFSSAATKIKRHIMHNHDLDSRYSGLWMVICWSLIIILSHSVCINQIHSLSADVKRITGQWPWKGASYCPNWLIPILHSKSAFQSPTRVRCGGQKKIYHVV